MLPGFIVLYYNVTILPAIHLLMRNLMILLCLLPLSSQSSINVLTSIQPLYLITSSIMSGVGEPQLLIRPGVSIHDSTFRPSQMRQLKQADLVIWIDRNFENGFGNLPEIIGTNTEQVELLRTLGLKQHDGHIWYSPRLLVQIVDQVRSALARIDPQNAEIYRLNSAQLSLLIESWAKSLDKQLGNTKPVYLLDHDFFTHFEKDMGVEAIAVLHDSKERPPSIRKLQTIEALLTRTPAKCLLYNESAPSKLARNIARKFGLSIYNISLNTSDLIQTLGHISSTLEKCS